MKGVILDFGSLAAEDLDLAALWGALPVWERHHQSAPAQVAERIADAEVVLTNKVVLDRATLQQARKLRLIAVMATGTNNVDVAAARELGITVCNCVGYATASVVQHSVGLMLALAARLCDYRDAVQRGDWQRSEFFCLLDYPVIELAGKTLGIVGFGALGQGVARVAEALGMQVAIAEMPGGSRDDRQRYPLPELLPRCDVLSLHCPLTETTRGLIDAYALSLLPPDAVLINTARGPIVDEHALAAALRGGRLAGAGLDVLAVEPPAADNPLLAEPLPNLIITPHSAWASRAARQRLVDQLTAVVCGFLADRPVNIVE